MNDISRNIKALRKEKGLSQEQLAQSLHVTRQTVSAWERGLSRPDLETLEQIAQVLGADASQVLYGSSAREKPSYYSVSFWPVLGIIPLFFVMVLWVLPLLMSLLTDINDTALLLCGQLFLAMLIMFCHCSLKDELRNWDFYARKEADESTEDAKQ